MCIYTDRSYRNLYEYGVHYSKAAGFYTIRISLFQAVEFHEKSFPTVGQAITPASVDYIELLK